MAEGEGDDFFGLFTGLMAGLDSSILMGLIAASTFIIALRKFAEAEVLKEKSLPTIAESTCSSFAGVSGFSLRGERSFFSFSFFSAMTDPRTFFFCCTFHSRYLWRLSSSFFALVLGVYSLFSRSCWGVGEERGAKSGEIEYV